MSISRRGFFGLVGLGAAAIVAPELVIPELWKPERTFFLPPLGGWRGGNTLMTTAYYTREAIRILSRELTFAAKVNYEHDLAFMTGDRWPETITIQRPPRYYLKT